MKVRNIFLTLISILFLGCTKENPRGEENPKEDLSVKFKVTGFESELIPLKSSIIANSTSDTLIRKLKFLVYSESNELVKSIDQIVEDDSFGEFELNLSKGKYKVGVVGFNKGFYSELSAPNKTPYILFPKHGEGPLSLDNSTIDEVFEYGYKVIDIKSDTTFAPFELKRITAKLEIKILDAIPNDSQWLLVSSEHDNQIRLFSDNNLIVSEYFNGGGVVNHHLVDLVGSTGNSFYSVILPFAKSGSKFDVNMVIYGNSGKVLFNQKIEDVEFKSNYLTRLSGEISAVQNEKFSVNVIKRYTDTLDVKF